MNGQMLRNDFETIAEKSKATLNNNQEKRSRFHIKHTFYNLDSTTKRYRQTFSDRQHKHFNV